MTRYRINKISINAAISFLSHRRKFFASLVHLADVRCALQVLSRNRLISEIHFYLFIVFFRFASSIIHVTLGRPQDVSRLLYLITNIYFWRRMCVGMTYRTNIIIGSIFLYSIANLGTDVWKRWIGSIPYWSRIYGLASFYVKLTIFFPPSCIYIRDPKINSRLFVMREADATLCCIVYRIHVQISWSPGIC